MFAVHEAVPGPEQETPLLELIKHCGPATMVELPEPMLPVRSGEAPMFGYLHPVHHCVFLTATLAGTRDLFERGAVAIPVLDEVGYLPGEWGLLMVSNFQGQLVCGIATFPAALPELHSIVRDRLARPAAEQDGRVTG